MRRAEAAGHEQLFRNRSPKVTSIMTVTPPCGHSGLCRMTLLRVLGAILRIWADSVWRRCNTGLDCGPLGQEVVPPGLSRECIDHGLHA